MKAKVLVIATSRKTRGGITRVIKAHERSSFWQDYSCRWIETHRDGSLLTKSYWLLRSFMAFLRALPSCKLLHIHTSEPPSAFRKCIFFMMPALLFRKQIIVHLHTFSPDSTINGKFSFLYRFMFKRADRVFVLSEYWKKEVLAKMPEVKAQVIHNPSMTEEQASVQDEEVVREKQIFYAGCINSRKGFADMLQAFAPIASRYPDWKLVFGGEGQIELGKKIAEDLGIKDQTVWLGWLSGKLLREAFLKSTIFCLPTYAEGFPMSVIDAWSYGLPVITTPVGGLPDVAIDGDNVLFFPPGDINALTDCMVRLMDNESLRNHLAVQSKLLVQSAFDMSIIDQQISQVYRELIG